MSTAQLSFIALGIFIVFVVSKYFIDKSMDKLSKENIF